MHRIPAALICALTITMRLTSTASADVLEVPANGGDASGIGYFSGWKCPPNTNITLVVDDGAPLPAATNIRRGDTSGICSNDGKNGYISQFNFNLLGDGNHTVSVRQNGAQFAQATFHVTTFGQSFLSGATGTYTLQNFPQAGQTATVEWSQGAQNFVIIGKGGGGPPTQCPANGPINNLLLDCSDFGYVYAKGGVTAAFSSDGDIAALCATSVSNPDVLCFGGPVLTATTFSLIGANINGGPLVPLDAGSSGNIANNGQTLNFTIGLQGEVFPFLGLSYVDTEPLSAASTESATAGALVRLRSALRATGEGASTSSSAHDAAQTTQVLGLLLEHLTQ